MLGATDPAIDFAKRSPTVWKKSSGGGIENSCCEYGIARSLQVQRLTDH
jgi:hypothetical protein